MTAGGQSKAETFALLAGHHASQDNTWGFCPANTVGVGIRRFFDSLSSAGKALPRIALIDGDIHHGDGRY